MVVTLSPWGRAALGAVALLALSGCDQFSLPAARAKVEEQARDAQNAGDYRKAIRLYESLLDGTEKSAKVHTDLALIYDDKLKDPVSALQSLSSLSRGVGRRERQDGGREVHRASPDGK